MGSLPNRSIYECFGESLRTPVTIQQDEKRSLAPENIQFIVKKTGETKNSLEPTLPNSYDYSGHGRKPLDLGERGRPIEVELAPGREAEQSKGRGQERGTT